MSLNSELHLHFKRKLCSATEALGFLKPVTRQNSRGFTIIELVLVILVLGVMSTLFIHRIGTVAYWRQQGFVRRLSETIVFLHHQAVVDQAFYRLEFDFGKNQYSVGVLNTEGDTSGIAQLGSSVGTLSLELAAFLSPSLGKSQTLIPPPSFPSLAEPIPLPEGMVVTDVRTMRGKKSAHEGSAYLLFSPRGFSEFGVIHLAREDGSAISILVNSFTGRTEIFNEYKDFEWSYGKKRSS